jgi:hypothetical protein
MRNILIINILVININININMQYSDYIKDETISHIDSINNFTDAITYFTVSKADIVSYNIQKNLKLSDVAMLEVDKDNNYIYDYELSRANSDVIDTFYFMSSNKNVKTHFIVNNTVYKTINTFITCLAAFDPFIVRFTFTEKPRLDDEITIYYKAYLLKNELRCAIGDNAIATDTNTYVNGTIIGLIN